MVGGNDTDDDPGPLPAPADEGDGSGAAGGSGEGARVGGSWCRSGPALNVYFASSAW